MVHPRANANSSAKPSSHTLRFALSFYLVFDKRKLLTELEICKTLGRIVTIKCLNNAERYL